MVLGASETPQIGHARVANLHAESALQQQQPVPNVLTIITSYLKPAQPIVVQESMGIHQIGLVKRVLQIA